MPQRCQQETSQSVALRQGCLLSPRHLRPRWRSHHHDRHRDKPKREEDRFLRKDHVAIEISEERPDAKLSRRQPLEKATAEIPDEEKGHSQTYEGSSQRGKRISAATVIAPFVTRGLMAFLEVTKNAWCSGKS